MRILQVGSRMEKKQKTIMDISLTDRWRRLIGYINPPAYRIAWGQAGPGTCYLLHARYASHNIRILAKSSLVEHENMKPISADAVGASISA